MIRAADFYTRRPFMSVCVLFSSIPFWVPLLALLINGSDPALMLMTAALSAVSGIFARSMNIEDFTNSPAYTVLKLVLFSIVFMLFAGYANLGTQADKILASIAVIIIFNFIFIRHASGFGFTNSLLWIFKTLLWAAFLYGLGSSYAILAVFIHIAIFYRRYGRA